MSLDRLVQKTIRSRVQKATALFLPPEYEIDKDEWVKLVEAFNKGPREARVASAILSYLKTLAKEKTDWSKLVTVGEIVQKDGQFVCDLSFENDKGGHAALYVFSVEGLRLVPIVPGGDMANGISHVSLTYIPD